MSNESLLPLNRNQRISLAENWRRREKFDDIKFIFPNAPSIPISINFNMVMPAWFDIVSRRDDVRHPDILPHIRVRLKSLTRSFRHPSPNSTGHMMNLVSYEAVQSWTSSSPKRLTLAYPRTVSCLVASVRVEQCLSSQGVSTTHKLAGVFGLSCYSAAER